MIEHPYGPGAICEDCGHSAARHDEEGCHGVLEHGCKLGQAGTKKKPKDCPAMLWQGVRWSRPWDENGMAS